MEGHGAEVFKEGITVEKSPEVAEAATTIDISATKTRAAPYAVNGHSGQSKFPYYGCSCDRHHYNVIVRGNFTYEINSLTMIHNSLKLIYLR